MVVVLVLVLVVLVGLWWLARRGAGRDRASAIEDVETTSQNVGYVVPPGTGPDGVLADLRAAGFSAVADPVHPRRLTIMLPLGPAQREAVRALLPGGSPRFADE